MGRLYNKNLRRGIAILFFLAGSMSAMAQDTIYNDTSKEIGKLQSGSADRQAGNGKSITKADN
jgi:hypothetical protein